MKAVGLERMRVIRRKYRSCLSGPAVSAVARYRCRRYPLHAVTNFRPVWGLAVGGRSSFTWLTCHPLTANQSGARSPAKCTGAHAGRNVQRWTTSRSRPPIGCCQANSETPYSLFTDGNDTWPSHEKLAELRDKLREAKDGYWSEIVKLHRHAAGLDWCSPLFHFTGDKLR